MNTFKKLLIEFDEVLRHYNLPNYSKLKPPLPINDIDAYFAELNIRNEELHMLYEWKNGVSLSKGSCEILKFGCFISLESIVNNTNFFTNETVPAIEEYSETKFWKSAFIPLTENYDDAILFFNNNPGIDNGKIFLFSPSLMFVDPISYYDSVYSMIETTNECYKQGIFIYDPINDFLDVNIDRYFELATSININSDYWKIKNH